MLGIAATVLHRSTSHDESGDGLCLADGDDSGTVGPEDLAIWEDHYGEVAQSSASVTTVPEPGSLVLLLTIASLAYRRGPVR